MGLKNIARALARDYGFPPSKEGDLYSFTVNDEYEISLELSPEGQRFALYCDVAPIPHKHREEIFRLILETNLFGSEIDHASLAIDPATDQIVLFLWMDEFIITYSEFLEHLSLFVENLQHWRQRISEYPAYEETLPQSSSSVMSHHHGIRI